MSSNLGVISEQPRTRARDSLTPLRGIAAFCVVVYHISENFPVLQTQSATLLPIVSRFYLWVDFFFILSGYIIALAYGDRLKSSSADERLRFLALRLARIYPLHISGNDCNRSPRLGELRWHSSTVFPQKSLSKFNSLPFVLAAFSRH